MRFILALLLLVTGSIASASTDPVKDTRQIMAGTVTSTLVKNAYLSGSRDSSVSFQGALAAYKAVRAAEPALTVTCADGTVIKAPGACPKPAPAPMPMSWVTAPFTDGGYARCKTAGGCHSISAPCPQGLTPPSVCSYPDIIAQAGDVRMYQWIGYGADYIGGFWPQGQYQVPYAGAEGWIKEWEGVKPAM